MQKGSRSGVDRDYEVGDDLLSCRGRAISRVLWFLRKSGWLSVIRAPNAPAMEGDGGASLRESPLNRNRLLGHICRRDSGRWR